MEPVKLNEMNLDTEPKSKIPLNPLDFKSVYCNEEDLVVLYPSLDL